MTVHVHAQAVFVVRLEVAQRATVLLRLFVVHFRMRPFHVRDQIRSRRVILLADFAHECVSSIVHHQMSFQRATVMGGEIALVAFEALLILTQQVQPLDVRFQIEFDAESLPTNATLEPLHVARFQAAHFDRMHPFHVRRQIVCLGEALMARLALERFRIQVVVVRQQMATQVRLIIARIIALRALERLAFGVGLRVLLFDVER